jgi:RNA polymerase sigma-70 factor, ECF subfamily
MTETGPQVEGFDRLVEPYRCELLAYCYRMLGSAHDAEDLVQDTYLRAWRARAQYDETRSSLRTWLYRIATNVCLTALEVRGRRPMPSGMVAASDPLGPLIPGEHAAWLQPLPDSLLDAGDPAGAVIDRSSLRLAFAAALQHLSARQRGALILRDVLSFSASEAADILGTTVVSVNSSLQRARARVKEAGVRQEHVGEPSAAEQRAWVDRYMKAFERADVEGLKRLLTEDVLMEMPPMVNWFTGPANYGLFMEWVFAVAGTDWHLKAVAANGQPGFAAYCRVGDGYQLHTLQVFTVTAEGISRNSVFQESEVFTSFGLAARLDAQGLVNAELRRARLVPAPPPVCTDEFAGTPQANRLQGENPMSDSRAHDKAAIEAILANSYKAWEAGDAAGMVADYTADATAIMTGSLRESRDMIRGNMALAFEGPLKGTSTWNKELSFRFIGRDAAIAVYESGILFGDQTEVPDAGKVNATWVFEKQDGQWLIAAYHNSPVLAPGQ